MSNMSYEFISGGRRSYFKSREFPSDRWQLSSQSEHNTPNRKHKSSPSVRKSLCLWVWLYSFHRRANQRKTKRRKNGATCWLTDRFQPEVWRMQNRSGDWLMAPFILCRGDKGGKKYNSSFSLSHMQHAAVKSSLYSRGAGRTIFLTCRGVCFAPRAGAKSAAEKF